MIDLESSAVLTSNYHAVVSQITAACEASHRAAQDVTLLAVSKKHSSSAIQSIYDLGQTSFGENYVQEGVDKVEALQGNKINWHFIGPLQSNKSRLVAQHFNWLHTLDREKLAKRLNEQRPNELEPLNVLIQVNISAQDSKSGVSLDEVDALANSIVKLPNLKLRGLMCIPAPHDETQLRTEFLAMQDKFLQLQKHYNDQSTVQIDTLSMGMSSDLSLAIECGSTMVRIGTAIFGKRTTN
jgi:pyridoxal phosphate enzyme (YggS family)